MQQQQQPSHHPRHQPLYQSHEYTAKELIRCKKWIQDALKYSGGSYRIQDIFYDILQGNMQLWSGLHGCMVTQIVTYPQKKVFFVFLAGGKLEQLYEMEDDMTDWAREQGCSEIELNGRLGWMKVLKNKNWNIQSVTLTKEINNG